MTIYSHPPGDLTSLKYPDGRLISQTYDSAQDLTGVQYASWNGQAVNTPYYSPTAFAPPGETTEATFGNGVRIGASFDSRQSIATLNYTTASQTLWSKQYTWAANAKNLLRIADTTNPAQTYNYTYDPDNRLATAQGGTGPGVLSETYTVDPWGNQQQSGSFGFIQPFSVDNRIAASGYSYDAAGDMLSDGNGNTFTYNAEGMATESDGIQAVYDAMDLAVAEIGGPNPAEIIYFAGWPIAFHFASNGSYLDFIWAGNRLVAEVPGAQTATPSYRLTDHEGSLVATTDGAANIIGTNFMTPYGQWMSSNTNDPYSYAGLIAATIYSFHAEYRNYTPAQARWLTPDPYNGSYDLNNPQSFNRYMYVNGNPLGYVDPSGKAGGVLNYFGTACGSHGFDLASPFVCAPIGLATNIACDFTSNPAACGFPGLTSFIPGPKWLGQSISASISAVDTIAGIVCFTSGGSACELALGILVYNVVNDVFAYFYDLFGGGGPQFTGSLTPRPTDLGGLGTSAIGIPTNNLKISSIIGHSHSHLASPGFNIPCVSSGETQCSR